MDKVKVQYLIGFCISEPFCRSQRAFLNLFRTLDDTVIESSTKIRYKELIVSYKIRTINREDENIKYYDLTLMINDEHNIENFIKFLSSVRKLLANVTSSAVETIWDSEIISVDS